MAIFIALINNFFLVSVKALKLTKISRKKVVQSDVN